MTIIEVFKTNVFDYEQAKQLVIKLGAYFPQCKINFDLQDCDKILRVEGVQVCPQKIIEVVTIHGYQCQVLD